MKPTTNAVETSGLGKRYRSFWALHDCSITIPTGSITALVGPNGAGKTTLLNLLAGLSQASAGSGSIFGKKFDRNPETLADIGYLAQEAPLYKQLSAAEHVAIGARMNARWDYHFIRNRLEASDIPLDRPVRTLSGGQRAQLALGLALAKRPRLLLLDEPVAALDPLAREDFLLSLTQAVAEAEGTLTVVLSSHLLGDLERICDHIILLTSGTTQLCDNIEHVLQTHRLLVGPRIDEPPAGANIIQATHTPRETSLIVRVQDSNFRDSHWHARDLHLEEIVLAYMRQAKVNTTAKKKGATE